MAERERPGETRAPTEPGADDRRPPGDRVPESDEAQEELVEETSEESFPASDPPSYWGRETDDRGQGDDR